MAGSESKIGPGRLRLQAASRHLGDWLFLAVAFLVVGGIWRAVCAVLFESAE
jgi:hypothetical protein